MRALGFALLALTLASSASARDTVSLTGIWQGTFYANQNGAVSKAYLNITEHADGSLSGRWGNSPNGALKIEYGERVTEGVFQWEASSEANEQGRYRVRANLKGKTLQLDITYTWREAGKVKGLTAASMLTKKAEKGFPIRAHSSFADGLLASAKCR